MESRASNDSQRLSKFRVLSLSILFLGVFSVFGRLVLLPETQKIQRTAPSTFIFPRDVSLSGRRSLSSYSIDRSQLSDLAQDRFISGQAYQYQLQDQFVKVEMFYTIETNGNAINFIEHYTSIPPAVTHSPLRVERYREDIGHYLFFEDQQQAYLVSCINPRGKSTITLPQFQRNRYSKDIWSSRLLHWLVSSQSIRDFRCLWVKMSVPLDGELPQDAFSTLENFWFSWYEWWQPRFPKS